MSSDSPSIVSSVRLINLTWLGLVIFTVVGYLLAESWLTGPWLTPLILSIVSIKTLLIAAVFMELNHVPRVFLAGFSFVVIGLALTLSLLLA